ncbi:MAG: hypothetical protein WAQ75_12110, partial [Propionicimonas sp.]
MFHQAKVALAAVSVAVLAGCATTSAASPPAPGTPAAPTQSRTLTVLTHDSFALSDKVIDGFKKSSGYD